MIPFPLKNSLHRSKTTAPSHTLKALSFYPLKNGTLSHSNPLLMRPASFQMVPLVPSRAPGYYVMSFRWYWAHISFSKMVPSFQRCSFFSCFSYHTFLSKMFLLFIFFISHLPSFSSPFLSFQSLADCQNFPFYNGTREIPCKTNNKK